MQADLKLAFATIYYIDLYSIVIQYMFLFAFSAHA